MENRKKITNTLTVQFNSQNNVKSSLLWWVVSGTKEKAFSNNKNGLVESNKPIRSPKIWCKLNIETAGKGVQANYNGFPFAASRISYYDLTK